MIVWILRQAFYVRKVFIGTDTPRQLAWGCALGMLLGLLPKGNLLFIALSTLVLSTRVNLGATMISALCFSAIGGFLDPLTHPIGWALLTFPPLEPFWTWAYSLPLVPWTSFNNTVVLGSLVIGVVSLYPTYRFSLTVVQRWRARIARLAKETGAPVEELEVFEASVVDEPGGSPKAETMFEPDRTAVTRATYGITFVATVTICEASDTRLPYVTWAGEPAGPPSFIVCSSLPSWELGAGTTIDAAASRVPPPLHWKATGLPTSTQQHVAVRRARGTANEDPASTTR